LRVKYDILVFKICPLALESAWFQPLRLKYDILVSKVAFKLNSCRYTAEDVLAWGTRWGSAR
jgi:hypothetical protein